MATYTFQRDGVEFHVNTSTHDGENNLGFCPKGFNEWGVLESQSNIQVKPFIHAVEIDWDGAVVNGTPVNTTGQLLKRIGDLEAKSAALESALITLAQNVGQLVTISNG